MHHLHEIIQHNVAGWRAAGYPCDDYPAIAEILDYARLPDGETLRFLRRAQLRALETYWYLRLVERTPHIFDLYRRYYSQPLDLLAALGLDREEIKDFVLNAGLDALWERIRSDDDFVRAHKLESVRETLTLDYPSYIFALAMGAGKTILISAIVATEFAMALEYHPGTEGPFVQNALAFAPGLTILESLRELPFTHPLTLMDLQLVKDELEARPDEERDVVVVCLGKELAVDAWLEEHNKHRPINRIESIELRTDQKYGKFFVHQPAEAQVSIQRRAGKIIVDIEDFISPTIVERLEMDTPLFRAKIPTGAPWSTWL